MFMSFVWPPSENDIWTTETANSLLGQKTKVNGLGIGEVIESDLQEDGNLKIVIWVKGGFVE